MTPLQTPIPAPRTITPEFVPLRRPATILTLVSQSIDNLPRKQLQLRHEPLSRTPKIEHQQTIMPIIEMAGGGQTAQKR
jgi:hypothetical protein